MKKGYVVFYVEDVTDMNRLKEYQAAGQPTLAEFGGTVIVAYGPREVVEGEDLKGVVIIEFPSYQAASGWYHSKAYQAAKQIRDLGAKCHAVVVEAKN